MPRDPGRTPLFYGEGVQGRAVKGMLDRLRRRMPLPRPYGSSVTLTPAQMQELAAMIQKPFQDLIDEIKATRAELTQAVTDGVAAAEAAKDQDTADGLAGVQAEVDGLKTDITAAIASATPASAPTPDAPAADVSASDAAATPAAPAAPALG